MWFRSAAEREIHECNGAWESGGGGIEQRAVSGGAGDGDFLQGVAAGSGAPDVDEQSGSGGGGEAGGFGGVRWNRKSGAELGMFSRNCEIVAGIGERRNVAGAVGKTGGDFSNP